MRITIRQYIEQNYAAGSRPTPQTVRRRLKSGQIPFRLVKEGGTYYIDLSERLTPNPGVNKIINA